MRLASDRRFHLCSLVWCILYCHQKVNAVAHEHVPESANMELFIRLSLAILEGNQHDLTLQHCGRDLSIKILVLFFVYIIAS